VPLHPGVDDSDLRGQCSAATCEKGVSGTVKLSDVMRVLLVYGMDIGKAVYKLNPVMAHSD
jgi:hypothetical protein